MLNSPYIHLNSPINIKLEGFKITGKTLNDFINSPLESSDASFFLSSEEEYKSHILNLLFYCYSLNLIIILLLITLILTITYKFVIKPNFIIEKIHYLPFPFSPLMRGISKYLPIFLNKLILSWQKSSILWIYFLLFFIFLFTCANTCFIFILYLTLQ